MHGKLVYFKCLLGFCLLIQVGQAQITNVNSTIKVIGVDAFYIHTVLNGQTLEAISTAYFTDVPSIKKYNNGIADPLSAGVKIKIPYSDASAEAMSKSSVQVSIPKAQPVYIRASDMKEEPVKPVKEQAQVTPMEEAISLLNKNVKTETAASNPRTAPKPENQPKPISDPIAQSKPVEAAKPPEVVEPESELIDEEAIAKVSEPIDTPSVVEEKATQKEDEPEMETTPSEPIDMEPIDIEKIPEDASPETQKALANLNELSRNINESLESLAKIQAVLNEPSPVNPETGELMESQTTLTLKANEVMLSGLLEQQFVNYFDTASNRKFELKEFFIADINTVHQIVKVKDERTVTNQNSKYLSLAELKGVTIDSLASSEKRIALGVIVDMTRHEYLVKVKRNKVRVYQTPAYVEHFPEGHPFASLILETAKNSGQRGKGTVVILNGFEEINSYKAFEYNPFGSVEKTIMRKSFSRIEQMEFN